jgi:hypothetical protein
MNQDGTPYNENGIVNDEKSVARGREYLMNALNNRAASGAKKFESVEERQQFLDSVIKNSKPSGSGDTSRRAPSLDNDVLVTASLPGGTDRITAALGDVDKELIDAARANMVEINTRPYAVSRIGGKVLRTYGNRFDAEEAVERAGGMFEVKELPKLDTSDMREVLKHALVLNMNKSKDSKAAGLDARPINYKSRINNITSIANLGKSEADILKRTYEKVFSNQYNLSENVSMPFAVKLTGMSEDSIKRLHGNFVKTSTTIDRGPALQISPTFGSGSSEYITLGDLALIIKQIPQKDYEAIFAAKK